MNDEEIEVEGMTEYIVSLSSCLTNIVTIIKSIENGHDRGIVWGYLQEPLRDAARQIAFLQTLYPDLFSD